jgi:8-hydroxy-5-deazaflavin:NADPH oxidoreductase
MAMRIAVLGTGSVGRVLAARLSGLGHRVKVGTRDPEATLARDVGDEASFRSWRDDHPGVDLATYRDAAATAELVINATAGTATLDVLSAATAESLAGKPLLDVSNPLDFSGGFPPTLSVKDTDSLAEQIQRAFPDARVVKALNTMNASVMAQPTVLGSSTTVFVSGDDPDAKATVTALLESFGHDDVIDLGDLSTARGPEMYLPLWLRTMQALGTAAFNIKVVRRAP